MQAVGQWWEISDVGRIKKSICQNELRSVALSVYTLQILGKHYLLSANWSQCIFIGTRRRPATKTWWKATKRKQGQHLGGSRLAIYQRGITNIRLIFRLGTEGAWFMTGKNYICHYWEAPPHQNGWIFSEIPSSVFSDSLKCISCWICIRIRTMVVWQNDVLARALITVIKWRLSKPTP